MSTYWEVAENIIRTVTAAGGQAAHPGAEERLINYWAHGKGAAKIRWFAPCAFCRCKRELGRIAARPNSGLRMSEVPGLCNHLEVRATGHPPNPEHSRTKHCVPC